MRATLGVLFGPTQGQPVPLLSCPPPPLWLAGTDTSDDAVPDGAMRLVNSSQPAGASSVVALVQTFYDGQWGAVCGSYFDWQEGRVVCKALGHASGVGYLRMSMPLLPAVHAGATWLDYLHCVGNETTLLACPRSSTELGVASCYDDYLAAVVCFQGGRETWGGRGRRCWRGWWWAQADEVVQQCANGPAPLPSLLVCSVGTRYHPHSTH